MTANINILFTIANVNRRAQEKVIVISDSDDSDDHSIENRSNAEYCLDSPPIIPSSDSDSVSELPDDKLPMVPPGLKTKLVYFFNIADYDLLHHYLGMVMIYQTVTPQVDASL